MLTTTQFSIIAPYLPAKRRPPKYSHKQALDGILFVLSSGCSWRQLPKEYGHWHTVYTRFKRWAEAGVLGKILHELHKQKIVDLRVVFLDSTTIRAHHSAAGARKKKGAQSFGRSRGGYTTKIHLIATGTHAGVAFALSAGHAHDAPAGRKLLKKTRLKRGTSVVMDKGYADSKTRKTIRGKRCIPVVPPKSNTKKPWTYDKELYKRRNEIERLFHHLKNYRRIATRYDKLDVVFSAFVALGLIMLALRIC